MWSATAPQPGSSVDTRLRTLTEIIGAFAEATTDYDELLAVIARKLAESIGDLCSVLLLSDDGSTLELTATHDVDGRVLSIARSTFSASPMAVVPMQQRVLESGDPLIVPVTSPGQIRQTTTERRADFVELIGMHSVMLVAMRARGQPLGLINLVRHRRDRPSYTAAEVEFARVIAEHAAVAVANARVLRRQYDQLRHAKEVAERASRELEAFSHSVAHDLRGPLRAIQGFSHALAEDHGDQLDASARGQLERVRAAGLRMSQLIDDILRLSSTSTGEIERVPVELVGLAEKILADLRARHPARDVQLTAQPPIHVVADPRYVRILLENLLGNAWKFTAGQSLATIELSREDHGVETVYVVRDNGAGFDMTHAAQLFLPFRRLHAEAEFEGNGVGLATAKRIVDRHGGRIWAKSERGRGAAFYFTLSPAE